jgi:predicted amidohydrolase
MIKARALENGCYVVAPDQVGNVYLGHSMAVDPLGRTLIDLDDKQGLAVVELDLNLVPEVRKNLPLLLNRRTDVYARYADARKLG